MNRGYKVVAIELAVSNVEGGLEMVHPLLYLFSQTFFGSLLNFFTN